MLKMTFWFMKQNIDLYEFKIFVKGQKIYLKILSQKKIFQVNQKVTSLTTKNGSFSLYVLFKLKFYSHITYTELDQALDEILFYTLLQIVVGSYEFDLPEEVKQKWIQKYHQLELVWSYELAKKVCCFNNLE